MSASDRIKLVGNVRFANNCANGFKTVIFDVLNIHAQRIQNIHARKKKKGKLPSDLLLCIELGTCINETSFLRVQPGVLQEELFPSTLFTLALHTKLAVPWLIPMKR